MLPDPAQMNPYLNRAERSMLLHRLIIMGNGKMNAIWINSLERLFITVITVE
jgi:hypothetical protein